MTIWKDKTVLITGGASGIGRLMAKKCLDRGVKKLVLWDLNEKGLEDFQREFSGGRANIEVSRVDLSSTEEIQKAAKECLEVDVLINNAGVVVGKNFEKHTHQEIEKTLQVNTSALMHLTLELMEGMKKRGRGHIINISSAAGMVSNPQMAVYCASKWAVIGWSDSLRLELERDYPGIKVTTVTPYYINTGMFDGVKSPIIPIMDPQVASERIMRAVEKNRVFLRMPRILYLVPLLKGILPLRIFDFLVGKVFGIYKSMEDFRGRGEK